MNFGTYLQYIQRHTKINQLCTLLTVHWKIFIGMLQWVIAHKWNICVTNDHAYVPLVNTSWSFPHSRLITGFVTRLIRRVPLVEQELLTLPEHLSSPPVCSGDASYKVLIHLDKKSLKIPKGQWETVYRRRTDNTMAKRKSTNNDRQNIHINIHKI
jgi:hypothetical protein